MLTEIMLSFIMDGRRFVLCIILERFHSTSMTCLLTPTPPPGRVLLRRWCWLVHQDLVSKLLTVDPEARITASEACMHPWLSTEMPQLSNNNLSAGLENLKVFNALRKLRAAIKTVRRGRSLVILLFSPEPHSLSKTWCFLLVLLMTSWKVLWAR